MNSTLTNQFVFQRDIRRIKKFRNGSLEFLKINFKLKEAIKALINENVTEATKAFLLGRYIYPVNITHYGDTNLEKVADFITEAFIKPEGLRDISFRQDQIEDFVKNDILNIIQNIFKDVNVIKYEWASKADKAVLFLHF